MVSVCLASYNGERFIKEQIESILSELLPEDELLISDDGSSDKTMQIINDLKDSRVKVYHNEFKNHIKNFEFLLNKVSGEYIFLSDQDDVWIAGKVRICLSHLQTYDLVLSNCILIDGNDNIIEESYFQKLPKTGFFRTFYKNIYTGCCLAFNRKILKYCLPFPDRLNSHDMWIGMIAELKGKPIVIKDRLIKFRRHGDNFSSSVSEDTFITHKSPYTFKQIVSDRLYMLKHLIKVLHVGK
ncbi:glycosyltransferase family 2 protein [Limibacterium fermenti]|uniref:glycosyltransferase family 2 protein n=1 Tax=Limibacterium fermenti TaxID=3229863 RepID=UPI003A790326